MPFAGKLQGYEDGQGETAKFFRPFGLCSDAKGNIYVADYWNGLVRKVTPTGAVTTIGGSTTGHVDGNLSSALFSTAIGVCVNPAGDLFVIEGKRVRKVHF